MSAKSIMITMRHLLATGFCVLSLATAAEQKLVIKEHTNLMDHGDGHLMDMEGGMVMGQNKDKLPGGCNKISEDAEITVYAGHKYAQKFPGTMFGFSEREWRIKPCARLTVHFVNEDNVRHQWMMHGLPKYIYDKGMFHLEVTGPAKISGTLILPKEDKTYLVHCDIAQHMEKGMKGQLIVGKGSGTFPSIPGVSDLAIPDNYVPTADGRAQPSVPPVGAGAEKPGEVAQKKSESGAPPRASATWFSGTLVLGFVAGLFGTPLVLRFGRERLRGMTAKDVLAMAIGFIGHVIDASIGLVNRILHTLREKK